MCLCVSMCVCVFGNHPLPCVGNYAPKSLLCPLLKLYYCVLLLLPSHLSLTPCFTFTVKFRFLVATSALGRTFPVKELLQVLSTSEEDVEELLLFHRLMSYAFGGGMFIAHTHTLSLSLSLSQSVYVREYACVQYFL